MDILADQLALARARGAVFSVLRRVRPWGLRFGGQRPLTAHVLIDGDGWLEQPGAEPVRLQARDAGRRTGPVAGPRPRWGCPPEPGTSGSASPAPPLSRSPTPDGADRTQRRGRR